MKNVALSLNNVGLNLLGVSHAILENINCDIYNGDFIILLGHNGSGKSSLLKILDRRYQATQGEILLYDKRLETYSSSQLAKQIATLTQEPRDSLFPSLTVLENGLLVNPQVKQSFFLNYLSQFNKNLPKKLDTPVVKLSGGEQQALVLALTILHPPKILLLDEHTSALDPKAAITLMTTTANIVSKHHITCVLSTHDLNLALNYGEKILVLADGRLTRIIDREQKKSLNTLDLLKMCY